MPFVKPEAGQGKWWRQLDTLHENLFVLQERRFWRSLYRIYNTWNNLHVAIASTKDDITKDWEELKKLSETDPELVELLKQKPADPKDPAKVEFLEKLNSFFSNIAAQAVTEGGQNETAEEGGEEDEDEDMDEFTVFDYDDTESSDLERSMTEDDPMRSALESIRGENQETPETATKQTPSNTTATEDSINKPTKSEVKKRARSASEKRKIGGTMILLTELKKDSDAPEPIYERVEGWLSKQAVSTTKANNSRWTNRYFLMERGCLFYYEISHLGNYSLEGLKIDDTSSSVPVSLMGLQKIGYSITLTTGTISLLIAAPTEAEVNSWKLALSDNYQEDETHKPTLLISASDDDELNVPEKRGWLFVQLPNTKWKYCYAAYKNKQLDIGEAFERGFFPLSDVNVELTSEVSFVIESPIKGFLHLTAATTEVMERWIINIRKAAKEEKKDVPHQNAPPTTQTAQNVPIAEDAALLKQKIQTDREAIRLIHLVRDIISQDEKRRLGRYTSQPSLSLLSSSPSFLSSSPSGYPNNRSQPSSLSSSPSGFPVPVLPSSYPPPFNPTIPNSSLSTPNLSTGITIGTVNSSSVSALTSALTASLKATQDHQFAVPTMPARKESAPNLTSAPPSTSFLDAPSLLSSSPAASIPKLLPPRKPKKTFNILSLDGGGMRGIMNTIILLRLVEAFPDFLDQFDLVTGTSNGGMIAAGLAFGFTPTACRHLIELTGKIVFLKDNTSSYLATPLSAAKFSNVYLKILCDEAWGKRRIKDATKYLMLPAFLLDNKAESTDKRSWETRFFHNLDDEPQSEDLVADVVMRTAAAPTYFPSYQSYVDGGMFAHDPASSALILSMTKLGKKASDIRILSFGTGRVLRHVDAESHNWGMYQWLPLLTSVLWDGMISQSEFICRELLGNGYHRLNPILKYDIPLDDPEQLPTLTQVAKELDLSPTIQWIKESIYAE